MTNKEILIEFTINTVRSGIESEVGNFQKEVEILRNILNLHENADKKEITLDVHHLIRMLHHLGSTEYLLNSIYNNMSKIEKLLNKND